MVEIAGTLEIVAERPSGDEESGAVALSADGSGCAEGTDAPDAASDDARDLRGVVNGIFDERDGIFDGGTGGTLRHKVLHFLLLLDIQ